MTAYRVITNHSELESVGQTSHEQIDQFVSTSQFALVSGSVNFASGSRIIRTTSGVLASDGGPGGYLTFYLDENYVRSLFTGSASQTLFVDHETPSGSINGENAVFYLQHAPNPQSSLHLFMNGLLQDANGYNFTLSNNVITFSDDNVPTNNDIIKASYRY